MFSRALGVSALAAGLPGRMQNVDFVFCRDFPAFYLSGQNVDFVARGGDDYAGGADGAALAAGAKPLRQKRTFLSERLISRFLPEKERLVEFCPSWR